MKVPTDLKTKMKSVPVTYDIYFTYKTYSKKIYKRIFDTNHLRKHVITKRSIYMYTEVV